MFKSLRVDISMMVICYASDVIEYDRRTPELCNALSHVKQDTTSIEQNPTPIALYPYDS